MTDPELETSNEIEMMRVGTLNPESGAQCCYFVNFIISPRYSQAVKTLLQGQGWGEIYKPYCQSINLQMGIDIYSD